jgi:hypothetical protein
MKSIKIILPFAAIALFFSFSIVSNNTNSKLPIEKNYQNFLAKFEKVSLPYALTIEPSVEFDIEDSDKFYAEKYLGFEFGEILPDIKKGMMSRMGPDDYAAEVLIASKSKFDVLIYSRNPSFREHKTYILATFDKKGKLISKQHIAGKNYSYTESCIISNDLKVKISKEANSQSDEKQSNSIVSAKNFEIKDNGDIVSLN